MSIFLLFNVLITVAFYLEVFLGKSYLQVTPGTQLTLTDSTAHICFQDKKHVTVWFEFTHFGQRPGLQPLWHYARI